MNPQKINTQEELDSLIENLNGNLLECFILLNYGLRSSKDISFTENKDYYVFNESDNSEEIIPRIDFNYSMIGMALNKGALYKYNY